MGIASLILGVLAFLISFSIFKDVSLILAVLGIVLGIIALVKKKSKGMSVAGIVLAIISFVILFSGGDTKTITTTSNNSGNDIKECKIGDTITIKNGTDEYTVQITGVKETDDRNEFSDKKPKQVFLIDYTYVCNKKEDGLYVSDMNFKIVDEQGKIGYK